MLVSGSMISEVIFLSAGPLQDATWRFSGVVFWVEVESPVSPTKVCSSAGTVSYDSFNFRQLLLSVSMSTSCSQHGHGANTSSHSQLNELHDKKALNYFQVWFILPHCSDAAIQPVFLSPGKPDLWASPSGESLVCVGRKSGSHFSSCLYFSLSGNCLREASAVLDWAEALRQDLPSWPTCAAFCLVAYPSPPLPCSFAPLAPPVFSGMTS